MDSSYNWEDIYPELVNKLRWAICTSLKTPGSNYPYSAGQAIATVLAQEVIDVAKMAIDNPGVLGSPGTVRSFLIQEVISLVDDRV